MNDLIKVNEIYNFISENFPGDSFELLKKYYLENFLLEDFLKSIGNSFGHEQDLFLMTTIGRSNFNKLSKLADKYKSDKGTLVENFLKHPWPSHNYTVIYENLYRNNRDSVKSVFEMGIGTSNPHLESNMTIDGVPGASLFMWREYFPNAKIFGGDIDKECMVKEERIQTHLIDQMDKSATKDMFETIGIHDFDLIIDDGLHTFEAGTAFFEIAIEYLSGKGHYVIEDIIQSDLNKYFGYFKEKNYRVNIIHGMRPSIPLFDNSIIVIQRD
jgi:hypothetical protein